MQAAHVQTGMERWERTAVYFAVLKVPVILAADAAESVSIQIEKEKERIKEKANCKRYIAYFQSFTNTYGDIDVLREKFMEAAYNPDIAVVDIATRPDCLGDDVLN